MLESAFLTFFDWARGRVSARGIRLKRPRDYSAPMHLAYSIARHHFVINQASSVRNLKCSTTCTVPFTNQVVSSHSRFRSGGKHEKASASTLQWHEGLSHACVMRPLCKAAIVLAFLFLSSFFTLLLRGSESMASGLLRRAMPPSVAGSFLHQPQSPVQKPLASAIEPIYTRTFTSTFSPNQSAMADKMSLFEAIKFRHSYYSLSASSPISDDRIQEIVQDTLLYVPSAFNSQTTRLVLVLKDQHKKLWQSIREVYRQQLAPEKFAHANGRFNGFEAAYGTVLCYEDGEVVREYAEKFKTYAAQFPNCMFPALFWFLLS